MLFISAGRDHRLIKGRIEGGEVWKQEGGGGDVTKEGRGVVHQNGIENH